MGDIKGLSVDNWQGARGTPITGGGTAEGDCRAPWLPSPALFSSAISVSNDGGAREHRA